jgi:hypothetical protein
LGCVKRRFTFIDVFRVLYRGQVFGMG